MKIKLPVAIAILTAFAFIGNLIAEQPGDTTTTTTSSSKSKKKPRSVNERLEFEKRQRSELKEFREQQQKENTKYLKSLNGKSAEDKEEITKAYKEKRATEESEFKAKQEAEIKEQLKIKQDKIIQDIQAGTLSAADKAAKIKKLQDKWAEDEVFYAKQRSDKILSKVGSDGRLDRGDKDISKTGTDESKKKETVATPAAAPATPAPAPAAAPAAAAE